MSTRMLIDATHSEETRVAIVKGNRVEDFDFESATKKQLKGNIYLAKVTRIEPSLQAAFVDYGGNRHGFLAFSEIHSDYYQIPKEDREALLAEEREAARQDDQHHDDHGDGDGSDNGNGENGNGEVEAIGAHQDDVADELPRRPRRLPRRYKIQEVIKRRQIMLVQVVKEERGNKGAALTTYLSLPGRYCVLMPNTHHGGGISRKIANPKDRRKLKEILKELDLPEGMGCIIRTAGLSRSKAEIRRDFDYLQRTWDEIRELTLRSIAPALIYEEGDLIKRAIRDLYNKDIDDILVEGDEGYRSAKNFMKLLMPSHAKKVKHYKDRIPLFHRYQVEGQLDAMYNPVVQLKSGGYIVINPTEALVAIDVNSGKSTREHNIEETALRTNLEAAEEVARQIRLRDMAGLVVIDFIDMEDRNNNRAVERRLKECLKSDRARIQVGKISAFGLLEMSRQRLRPGILEASTTPCPHCDGTGIIRSVESAALHVLRAIEEEGIRGRSAVVHVHVPQAVALYLLNQKRAKISEIESHYGFRLVIEVDDGLVAPKYRMERENLPRDIERERSADLGEPVILVEDDDVPDEPEDAEEAEAAAEGESRGNGDARAQGNGERGEGQERRKRRRRRRRRGGDRQPGDQANGNAPALEAEGDDHGAEQELAAEGEELAPADVSGEEAVAAADEDHGENGDSEERKRRRRGRRGGRRRSRGEQQVSGA
ncbi:MAG TPA: ribonuclease E/G, partial [Sphingomonadales bacterium]